MPDYSKAKIYALRSHQTHEIWIGSTTEALSKRMTKHRMFHYPGASWLIQDEVFKYGDCYIELIEKYPCECLEELVKRRNEIIREMDCLNKKKEEYRRNKEEKRVKKNIKAKEYRRNKEEKRVKKNIKAKEYRRKNKDKINQREAVRRKRVVCACRGSYADYPSDKNRHLKTKKHQQYISSKDKIIS